MGCQWYCPSHIGEYFMGRAEREIVSLPPPPRVRAADIALFLDVDGTLLEIEREPGAVHVPEHLCRILEQLQKATTGALALVSGRSLAQLDRLFAPLRFSAAGLHGLERRNLGRKTIRAASDPEVLEKARRRLAAFAEVNRPFWRRSRSSVGVRSSPATT
jgi:trehalose 6-phosphate phosphatase